MAKLSKQIVYFEQICKEVDLFKQKVEDCTITQVKIKVFKENAKQLETNLFNAFNKLNVNENEDNFPTYLKYKEVILELLIYLEEKTEVVLNSENRTESKIKLKNNNKSLVRLPKFDLPKFYGESDSWISFKEIFVSTIIKNEQLSKIEKLQYLQSSIQGKAAKLIRGFAIKAENLENCWDLLCERYENKRQLALSQINKIFSVKVVKANNSKNLLELLDTCNESVRNLKTLGLESNALSDLMLINFMVEKLDESIKQRWELALDNDNIPNLELFRKFIEREARSLEDSKSNKLESKFNSTRKLLEGNSVKNQSIVNSAIVDKGNGCILCHQNHQLYKCPSFNSKSVTERWNIVEINNLCENCLRSNHEKENCRINLGCKNCSEKHHTALHRYSNNQNSENVNNVASGSSVSNSAQSLSSNVLLSTALVKVQDNTGKFIQCRALIDNASQHSLITKECAKRLNLPLHSTSHSLVGINGIPAETSLHMAEFQFAPHFNNQFDSVQALVVNQVTSPLPNFRLGKVKWPHTHNLQLADPFFHRTTSIDLLLGADVFAYLDIGNPITGPQGSPTAFPTKLGVILCGKVNVEPSTNSKGLCHLAISNFIERSSNSFKDQSNNIIHDSNLQSAHIDNSNLSCNSKEPSKPQSFHKMNSAMKSRQKNSTKIKPNPKERNSRSAANEKSTYLKNHGKIQNNSKQFQQAESVNIPCRQTLNCSPNIQYRPFAATSNKIDSNVPLKVDKSALNSSILPNNFNAGFNNSVCCSIQPSPVQFPYTTIISPTIPEKMQSLQPILPQNGFHNPSSESPVNPHSFYFGSGINNNTVAFNMPDQILPDFTYSNHNCLQTPLFCTPIKMQRNQTLLSQSNFHPTYLQGGLTPRFLNQDIFSQVILIEEPVFYSPDLNSQAPNVMVQ